MSTSKQLIAATVALLSLADLGAWGRAEMQAIDTTDSVHFPFYENQQWSTEESLLVWKPYEDDLDYADKRTTSDVTSTTSDFDDRLKHPSFKWSTGVRVSLGKYLPKHDKWDVKVTGTYFYSDADNHSTVDFSNNERFFSLWNTAFFLNPLKASSSWKLNYFTTDLLFGRYFSLTSNLYVHPYIGVRGAYIFQDYKASYLSTNSVTVINLLKLSFKAAHDYLGGGPRIGTDFTFEFGHGWSFQANIAASFLYGRQSIHEQINGQAFHFGLKPLVLKVNDLGSMLRSEIDGSIGLCWEKWVRNQTVRIAPSFQVEATNWFALKHWVDTHAPTNIIPTTSDMNLQSRRRYSDLGLLGFNVNLHIDF